MRSEAKNQVRIENLHGKEAAEDREIVRDLELVGWIGKDVLQKIEVIKSSGKTAAMIKINRTKVDFLQAELTEDTSEDIFYVDFAKQGATRKELKEVARAARELNGMDSQPSSRAVPAAPRESRRRLSERDSESKGAEGTKGRTLGMAEEPG